MLEAGADGGRGYKPHLSIFAATALSQRTVDSLHGPPLTINGSNRLANHRTRHPFINARFCQILWAGSIPRGLRLKTLQISALSIYIPGVACRECPRHAVSEPARKHQVHGPDPFAFPQRRLCGSSTSEHLSLSCRVVAMINY